MSVRERLERKWASSWHFVFLSVPLPLSLSVSQFFLLVPTALHTTYHCAGSSKICASAAKEHLAWARERDWLTDWKSNGHRLRSQCPLSACTAGKTAVQSSRSDAETHRKIELRVNMGKGDCQNRTVHLIHFSLRQSRQRQTGFCSISSRQCCWWCRPFPADASYFLLPFFKKFMDTLFTG